MLESFTRNINNLLLTGHFTIFNIKDILFVTYILIKALQNVKFKQKFSNQKLFIFIKSLIKNMCVSVYILNFLKQLAPNGCYHQDVI